MARFIIVGARLGKLGIAMQQNERIELIKAAAMLTAAAVQSNRVLIEQVSVIQLFDQYHDYLQLKLEASGHANENN